VVVIMIKPPLQRRSSGCRGLAVIEMAFVLPLFLIVVFGGVNFAVGLYNQAVITNASREAAREGIAFRVPAPTYQEITSKALTYCQNHLVTFGTQVQPQVQIEEPQGRLPGAPLRVTVTYAYQGLQIFSGLSPGTLSATSTMTYE